MVGDFQRFILHTDLTRIFYNEIFEHESHELNEYFIAHGSHGSHGFLFAALRSRFLNTRFAVGPLTEGK